MQENLSGFLFEDKRYISDKTTSELLKEWLQLITKVRQNMKPKVISEQNKFLLYKRKIIETIFGFPTPRSYQIPIKNQLTSLHAKPR